jgi:hypothetical protein
MLMISATTIGDDASPEIIAALKKNIERQREWLKQLEERRKNK